MQIEGYWLNRDHPRDCQGIWRHLLLEQQRADINACAGCMQGDELAVRMREALQKGTLGISALSPRVTTGKEQWQEWHHDFYQNQMQDFIQDDIDLHTTADEMNTDLEVITLREAKQTALEVWCSF